MPIYSGGPLSLAFVEVGCQPRSKKKQLKEKTQLLLKYWGDNFRDSSRWHPQIKRILVHYEPLDAPCLDSKKAYIDCLITYSSITEKQLRSLDDKDKENIFSVVTKNEGLLAKIIMDSDSEMLHKIIMAERYDQHYCVLRGKMAEILALKDIQANLPKDMLFFQNGLLKYFSKYYKHGTEIDGILAFYDDKNYNMLLDNLSDIENICLKRRQV